MDAKSVVYFGPPITKNSSIYLQNSSFQLNEKVCLSTFYIQSNIIFGDNATVTFSGGLEPGKSSGVLVEQYSIATCEGNIEVTFATYKYNYGGALYIH